jgi:hypothetical protein
MAVRSANQFDGELAALRHQREMDALGESPVVDQVLDVTVRLAEKAGLPPFMGLFRKALKLGQPSVEKMVDDLESAAFEEIRRIWERLHGQAERQKEFEARLNSHEAQVAYLSACFHGLRTSDPQKHSRLARLTINCVFADDLGPESLDDMMGAAVELTDWDIFVLRKIYETQKNILVSSAFSYDWTTNVGNVWTEWGGIFGLRDDQHLKLRPALSRLQSLGLIAEAQTNFVKDGSLARQPFGLLPEGKKFYERLQEIAVQQ